MKVLKFGASWCLGCKVMKPRWRQIEEEHSWLQTTYIDYDENPDVVKQYQVDDVLPQCIFLDSKGNEIDRKKGELTKEQIIALITKYKDK